MQIRRSKPRHSHSPRLIIPLQPPSHHQKQNIQRQKIGHTVPIRSTSNVGKTNQTRSIREAPIMAISIPQSGAKNKQFFLHPDSPFPSPNPAARYNPPTNPEAASCAQSPCF